VSNKSWRAACPLGFDPTSDGSPVEAGGRLFPGSERPQPGCSRLRIGPPEKASDAVAADPPVRARVSAPRAAEFSGPSLLFRIRNRLSNGVPAVRRAPGRLCAVLCSIHEKGLKLDVWESREIEMRPDNVPRHRIFARKSNPVTATNSARNQVWREPSRAHYLAEIVHRQRQLRPKRLRG
jgi:hypothetical protein